MFLRILCRGFFSPFQFQILVRQLLGGGHLKRNRQVDGHNGDLFCRGQQLRRRGASRLTGTLEVMRVVGLLDATSLPAHLLAIFHILVDAFALVAVAKIGYRSVGLVKDFKGSSIGFRLFFCFRLWLVYPRVQIQTNKKLIN